MHSPSIVRGLISDITSNGGGGRVDMVSHNRPLSYYDEGFSVIGYMENSLLWSKQSDAQTL